MDAHDGQLMQTLSHSGWASLNLEWECISNGPP